MNSDRNPEFLLALALLFEIVGVILLLGPFGSALSNLDWERWDVGWLVGLGTMILVPWFIRWFGGPKPWSVFVGDSPGAFFTSLYKAILVGVVITAYKSALSLVIWSRGASFQDILPTRDLWGDSAAFIPALVTSLATGYFVFGYLQGLVARVINEKAGMFVAVLLYSLGTCWPLDAFPAEFTGVPRWVILLAAVLPTSFALGYLRKRSGSVITVITAILVIDWLSGVGSAIYANLGAFVLIIALAVMLLIGIEVIIGERRRAGRFITGFIKDVAKGWGSSAVDGALLTAAVIALLFTARTADLFFLPVYIYMPIAGFLVITALTLWTIYSIIRKRHISGD